MDKIPSGSSELSQLLADMNQEGGFSISVLTDRQGLPIAFASAPGYDPDRQSAAVAFVQKTVNQASEQIGFTTDEITLNAVDGQRLICRLFKIKDQNLILAVVIPLRQGSFRRLTNQAIHSIRRIWKTYWE
jgi:predicted regulator of Ras-like GTPase activity (Roadblock/LC7/MglB family)